MTHPSAHIVLALALMLASAAAQAQSSPAGAGPVTRGQALYNTHCIACHTTQVHWRDARLATDWDSLKREVRRWQATNALAWSEADVVHVARHLNEAYYRYPQTSDLIGFARPRP